MKRKTDLPKKIFLFFTLAVISIYTSACIHFFYVQIYLQKNFFFIYSPVDKEKIIKFPFVGIRDKEKGSIISNGIILSSDGWIVTNGTVEPFLRKKNIQIFSDNFFYDVEHFILLKENDLAFLKMNASLFPVMSFSRTFQQAGTIPVEVTDYTNISQHASLEVIDLSKQETITAELSPLSFLFIEPRDAYATSSGIFSDKIFLGILSSGRTKMIPAIEIQKFAFSMFEEKKALSPYAGFLYHSVLVDALLHPVEVGEISALHIDTVIKNSPSFLAGLEYGDLLYKVDGQYIKNSEDWYYTLVSSRFGEPKTLTFLRGDSSITKDIFFSFLP